MLQKEIKNIGSRVKADLRGENHVAIHKQKGISSGVRTCADTMMRGEQMIINVYAKFHHNIPLSSRDRAIFTFSEFGARQSLDRWKMSFRNLLG